MDLDRKDFVLLEGGDRFIAQADIHLAEADHKHFVAGIALAKNIITTFIRAEVGGIAKKGYFNGISN